MKLANPFTSLTEQTLSEIVQRLVPALHPMAIYLFGSHALGVPRSDSDIDLMLIVKDDPPRVELHQRGLEATRDLHLPIQLHFCPQGRFERFATVFGTFQHEVHTKGVLLYATET